VSQLEQAELKRKQEEQHRLYLASIKKYAVVVINYQKAAPVIQNRIVSQSPPEKYVSNVIEVSSNLTKDDEAKILDQHMKNIVLDFLDLSGITHKGRIFNKKLHIFNTYSEASNFRNREEYPN